MMHTGKPESFGLVRTIRNGKWVTLSCKKALEGVKKPQGYERGPAVKLSSMCTVKKLIRAQVTDAARAFR